MVILNSISRRSAHVARTVTLRSLSVLTPSEAGRRAAAMMAERQAKDPSAIATILSHSGMDAKGDNIPMAPPLHVATTYTRPADGIYRDGDSVYARMDNPTRLQLEKAIFELECINLAGREDKAITSYAFSSGLAGVTSILLAHSSPLTVLLPDDLYHGVSSLLSNVFSKHRVNARHVNMRDVSEIVKAIQSVNSNDDVIVWMESPSNPKCHVLDIQSICQAVEPLRSSYTITTVVDGTMASPILTRPLELGADVSFHSGTKYLAGHSDALLGLVTLSPVTSRGHELVSAMNDAQILGGAVASPFDSWLTLRGMRTLHVRVERQCKTTQQLVEYLEKQKEQMKIIHLYYPGLISHQQHDVAKRQMQGGFGGVFSMEFDDEATAMAFAAALQTVHRATSLGGPETLIEHRASIEPPERRTSPPGLLRVSIGLEDINDLIRDFEMAAGIAQEIVK
ncbi:cystathionine gamma-synthase [Nitzschia inconspicua]|uniref:cystathionine gamma-lyase n=1 Tax=Nitzschia inconspicua TaxID=303405 RepID=A0A9K3LEK9_9STRA|nr:cystathionine gamma-synthase [Nitzschia inconspicua]